MECVLQGRFSHVGSIKTTENQLLVMIEHARTCRTDFLRYLGSKSGTTRHGHVHM